MKDGRPSRLSDIRYFGLKKSRERLELMLRVYGRRLAWWLNGEDFSIGASPVLDLHFARLTQDRTPEQLVDGPLWWAKRYDLAGHDLSPDDQAAIVQLRQRTVWALQRIVPDAADLVLEADRIVAEEGGFIRFLVRSKRFKHATLDVATTISDIPQDDVLVASLREDAGGERVELPPFATGIYAEAPIEARGVRMSDIAITRMPNGDIGAAWKAESGLPLPTVAGRDIGRERPVYSKLVRLR